MGRTREMPIADWTTSSANWTDAIDWRYPIGPTKPIVNSIRQSGRSEQTNPSLRGRRVTVDENHGLSAKRLSIERAFIGDIGGGFSSTTSAVFANANQQHMKFHGEYQNNWIDEETFSPVFAVNPRTLAFPTHSGQNLTAMGTTAIARCKPTNNVVDLATDLSEIFTAGLPHLLGHTLWKKGTSTAKKAGQEYLNSEFGWAPLVSDIRGGSYALANAARLLEAYQRNSGKIVRRRYEFPVVQTKVTTNLGAADAVHLATNGTYVRDTSHPMPTLYRTTEFFQRTWFSGAFTYHLPADWYSRDWFLRNKARAGYLLGIELTPDTVWNAMPWTWALDWFSNAGDVMTNLSNWSSDGLVLKWGYIMEHTVTKSTYTLSGTPRLLPYGTINASPVTSWYETKKRQRATPFGFGLTWNMLTPRQLAISAALGLTRW
jgi:hypothetical protein